MKEGIYKPKGIYYRASDFKEDRPTIVLMHGLSGHSSAWGPYEAFLGDTHNIVEFDLRGHGKSRKYPAYKDYTIPLFAEDLFDLVNFLTIKKFTVLTHSFGSLIALEFAKHHQEMLSKLILMSPSFSVKRPISTVVKPFLTATRALEWLPFKETVGYHFDYTRHKNARDWNISMTFNDVRNTGLRAYLFSSRQAFEVDYDEILESIQVPTLLIHGKKDTIFPVKNTVAMEKRIPHAKAVFLETGDHIIVVNTSYVPEIKKAILSFL